MTSMYQLLGFLACEAKEYMFMFLARSSVDKCPKYHEALTCISRDLVPMETVSVKD